MKKSISVFVFVWALSAAAWAQSPSYAPVTDTGTTINPPTSSSSVWSTGAPSSGSILPGSPKSVPNASSAGLFGTDIDNFLHANSYGSVSFEKLYVFLGGASASSGITGGVATKLGANYLAFSTSGLFVPVGGKIVKEEDDVSVGNRYEEQTSKWNNTFSLLWGNPIVGGLRFDLAFADSAANTLTKDKEADTFTENKTFITALRWSGLKLGAFSLRPTVAFQWPEYAKKVSTADPTPDVDTEESWENAALDVKLEGVIGNFYGYYELLLDFGKTRKGDSSLPVKDWKITDAGYGVHTLYLRYTATRDADEKFQFKARPILKAELYTKADKTTWDYADRPDADDGETDNGSESAFRLTPSLDVGVSWKMLPKLTLYTGTTITPFTLTTFESKEGDDGGSNGKKSYLAGGSIGNLSFGLEFNPSPVLGIEFGVTSGTYVDLSHGEYDLDITSYEGKFAVKVKL
jgi:hypothetical protein